MQCPGVAELSSDFAGSPRYVAGSLLAFRYELVCPLGAGGMGIVWVARDTVLNVEVALKLFAHPDREASARAQTEARAAARLAHPAACRVIDYGRTEHDDPFVVTELLSGRPLDDILERRRRLPPVEAVRTLLPILDALETAHASGIVHRDVKPSNLFLAATTRGVQPKLLDFGIARFMGQSTRHTLTGTLVGTPDYMSPEQARGERDVGPETDLWGFSATLYETISGNLPFPGENYNVVLWAIQNSDPVPLTTACACDPALDRIVLRGLRRDPAARWPSAADLARELSLWLLEQGVDTDLCGNSLRWRSPASSRNAVTISIDRERAASAERRSHLRVALAVLVASSVAGTASYALTRATSSPTEERQPPLALARALEVEPAPPPSAVTPRPPAITPAQAPPEPVMALADPAEPAPPRRAPTPTKPAARIAHAPITIPLAPFTPPPRAPLAPPPPKKRNALGYDFGL